MTGYVLTWRGGTGVQPLEAALLRPDTLGALGSAEEVARQLLPVGRTTVPLGDWFHVTGSAGLRLTLRDCPPLARLGAQMKAGELIVEGDAGDDLAAALGGGTVRVTGDAGANVGGPLDSTTRGMTGGEIIVHGNVGARPGWRMRRGLLAVGGICGELPGYEMLAGTLVLNQCAELSTLGTAARRGTLLTLTPEPLPADDERYALDSVLKADHFTALRLVLRRLEQLNYPVPASAWSARYALRSGDRLELNRAEQWIALQA